MDLFKHETAYGSKTRRKLNQFKTTTRTFWQQTIFMYLVALLLSINQVMAATGQCTITTNNYDVNYQPNEFFYRIRVDGGETGTQAILLQFPVDLYMSFSGAVVQGNDGFTSSSPTVTVLSSTTEYDQVLIQNTNTQWYYFQFFLQQIKNPAIGKTSNNFKCIVCKDLNCNNQFGIFTVTPQKFFPVTLASNQVTYSSSSQVNGASPATMTIQAIIANDILPYGSITLVLPNYNSNFKDYGSVPTGLIQDTSSFQIEVSEGIQNSGQYTQVQLNGTATQRSNIDFTGHQLFIKLNNLAKIDKNRVVFVKIGNIRNPPSLMALSGFEFRTGDHDENFIEKAVDGQLQNSQSGVFGSSSNIQVLGSTMVSATQVKYKFNILTGNDIPKDAQIIINFPVINNQNTIDCSQTYQMSDVFNIKQVIPVCEPTSNRLLIDGGFNEMYNYLQSPAEIYFTLEPFTNPPTTEQAFYTIETLQSTNTITKYSIDKSTDQFSIVATTGSITISSILPNRTEIYFSEGKYQFILTPEHNIETDYQFQITFPSTFGILQNSACTVSGLGPSTTCVADPTNRQIILGKLFDSTVSGGTSLTFSVNSIQNPGIYESPGQIRIDMTTKVGGPVDTGYFTMPGNLYSATDILQFYAYADDTQAGTSDVRYRFKLQPRQRVAKDAYIILELPPELTISDQDTLRRQCHRYQSNWISGFAYNYLQCSYDQDDNTVKIMNGFKTNASASDPPILQWAIPGIQNPRAQITTQPFNVTIYDKSGKIFYFYNQTGSPVVSMTGHKYPYAIDYSRNSYQNGMPSNYTWRIVSNSFLQEGDQLVWKLPHPIVFARNSSVVGSSYWVDKVQPVQVSGSQDQITATLTLSSSLRRRLMAQFLLADEESFKKLSPLSYRRRLQLQPKTIPKLAPINFTITEIASLPSMRPVQGSISFKILTSEGNLIESIDAGLAIENKSPGQMDPNQTEAVASYFEKGKLANYTFSYMPLNFERNMRMYIGIPVEIKVPDPPICKGLNGTDKRNLTCEHIEFNNSIMISDGFTTMDISRGQVVLFFENFTNPEDDLETSEFTVQTKTYDYYAIDNMLKGGPTINFICVFPCRTCNLSQPTQCYSCYWQTTEYKYLYQDQCQQNCSTGLYEILTPDVQTCDFCQSPCATCTINATYCETCIPGYLLYEKDRTCYEIIEWPFPFLFAASFFFLLVLCVDCFRKSTNFLQALLFFLSFLEVGVWAMLVYLWIIGKVEGQRNLSIVSLGVQILLNIVFIPIHAKLMMDAATPEYKQVFQQFSCTSWFLQSLAYVLNFKMSLILISQFASRPRFSGTYGQDSWQKFNIFAIIYIVLVYLPFMADFYIYFTTYGLRQFATYVAIEAVVIMTVICLILLLEILQQCQCAGILERDLGKRAGLSNELKKGKKKRRAARSGMGNDESDYGDYDSEHDYYLEDDGEDVEESEQEKEEDEDYDDEDDDDDDDDDEDSFDEQGNKKTKGKTKGNAAFKKMQTQNKKQLEMLEKLANQIKKEKEIMKQEHDKVLKSKMDMLNEKEKYFSDADKLKKGFDDDTMKLMNELKDMEKHKEGLVNTVDERIDEKLAQNKNPIGLPKPVIDKIQMNKSETDEIGLNNLTPLRGDISDRSKIKEMDASTIQHMSLSPAKVSYLNSVREGEDDQEMRARMSTGPIKGDDLSIGKSIHATEKNFLNRSNNDGVSGIQGLDDGSRERDGTEKDFYDKASAIFSNADGSLSRNATQKNFDGTPEGKVKEGTDIDAMDRKSAAFGSISELQKQGSQQDFIDKSDAAFDKDSQVKELVGPHIDQTGRSSESSEGIVADHAPFKGIKDAMRDQDKLRRDAPPEGSSEEDEDNRPSAKRRIKQVLYSDKSESSVDDMMEDTPSNYNIANGRLEGKSMGLKAILLFAKNQGIALGGDQSQAAANGGGFRPGQQLNGPLPQIQEEAPVATPAMNRDAPHNSSTEGAQWKAMNQPITDRRTTILEEGHSPNAVGNNTIDLDGSQGLRKKQPPKKQFKEPGDNDELAKLQKNNFV